MTNLINLNQIVIKYSAPTLCGIKPANMFTVSLQNFSRKELDYWKSSFKKQGILFSAFNVSDKSIMIFVCNYLWIQKILSDSFVRAYLAGKNYNCSEKIPKTKEILMELFKRLQLHESFPHEVGIFLGYPIEDVICFEENCGKNCKFCGSWKSYCSPEEAKKCFECYKNCSLVCKKWFDEGYSIPQIIKKYKKMVQKAA